MTQSFLSSLPLTCSDVCVLQQALREWRTSAPESIIQAPDAYQRWRDERATHGADLVILDNTLTERLSTLVDEGRSPSERVVMTLPLTPARRELVQAALSEWRLTPPMEFRNDARRLHRWQEYRELYEDTITGLLQRLQST